jgi:arylsulfatase A-like enzyme
MPALDRLADNATRYKSAFANGTNTGVSLPSLLTSQYYGRDPCINGQTIATVLSNAGVRTAGFHSNTLFANLVGIPDGFDEFQDFGVRENESNEKHTSLLRQIYLKSADGIKPLAERLGIKSFAKRVRNSLLPDSALHSMSYYVNGEELTDTVVDWLQKHSDESFFLWVHYLDPHRPYGIDLDDPAYGERVDLSEIQNLMSKAGIHPSFVTDAERKRIIDLYDSDLRYTSQAIDRLFDELEELDIWDDTAVICTSDHGEEFGEHKNYFHRNVPYDEILHVPLFVKAPSYTNDVVTDPRELLDIAPTICEVMNIEEQMFHGIPLSCADDRQIIATGSFAELGPVVAGRWGGWKYISTADGEEVYNLRADPSEQQNLVDERSEVVSRYRNSIPDYLFEKSQDSFEQTNNKAVEERLRGLGYLE